MHLKELTRNVKSQLQTRIALGFRLEHAMVGHTYNDTVNICCLLIHVSGTYFDLTTIAAVLLIG